MSVSSQQWYPQQQGAVPQWSPPGTPGGGSFPPTVSSPWGGAYPPGNLTPQQLAQAQLLNQTQTAAQTPGQSPQGAVPPGTLGQPGMPGMYPGMYGYPPQQECCGTCCGPSGGLCGPSCGGECCASQGGCCGPQGGCCGPQSGCCGPQQGGCCQQPGEPPDPYLCTPAPPGERSCFECIYNCFDYTYLLMIVFALLSVVGFAVVLGTKQMDDLFTTMGCTTTAEMNIAIKPYIKGYFEVEDSSSSTMESDSSFSLSSSDSASSPTSDSSSSSSEVHPPVCTIRKLVGSFGGVCLEDSLNANVFAVQLSHWNNARDTLWFLALLYSIIAVVYAALIHIQRNPTSDTPMTLTPEKQQEYLAMTPAQQQAFMQQFQQEQLQHQQQQMQAQGCCGRKGVEVYDTPFYEFFRIAWLFSGFTALVWACNLLVSFWSFSSFYVNNTTGLLQDFWKSYASKFSASVIVVTIYLAWPFFNFFVELVVWLVGLLPWFVIRKCCKEGINLYRPSLPNAQLPCCIRSDMFFTEFNDVFRLGFSRQAWIMLTGSERPFFQVCGDDPNVDRDPAMTRLLTARAQWQLMHPMGMMGYPGMYPGLAGAPGLPPGMPGMPGAWTGMTTPPPSPGYGVTGPSTPQNENVSVRDGDGEGEGEGEEEGRKKRRHRSRSRSRSKQRSSGGHVDPKLEQTSGADGLERHRKHRRGSSRSASKAEGDSRSRRHRSASPGEGGSRSRSHRRHEKTDPLAVTNDPLLGMPPLPPPIPSTTAVPGLAAVPAAPEPEKERRHRSSKSRERSGAGGENRERRHRSSREKSKAGEGERERRHRSSKSREKPSASGGESGRHRSSSHRNKERKETNKDLDALMDL